MDPLSDKHWSKTKLIPGGAFDECIAAMFGIGCSYLINGRTVNKYAPNSQLFETNQFADVVAGLNAVRGDPFRMALTRPHDSPLCPMLSIL